MVTVFLNVELYLQFVNFDCEKRINSAFTFTKKCSAFTFHH